MVGFYHCSFLAILALCAQLSLATLRPVVIWHGLGDTFDSPGMRRTEELIQTVHPEIFVHAVYLSNSSSQDRTDSVFGNVTEQLETVCQQLASMEELKDGFDGIGFSQGGLFLRAYAEKCNNPAVRRLITFGSPHNGISDLPLCPPRDFICKRRNQLLKSQVWSSYAQSSIVSAQYFRNPSDMESYLAYSSFLAEVNNERTTKNSEYARNLNNTEMLVMYLFTEDETLVPKESAWFQEVDPESGDVIPLHDRNIYKENWIGMRDLGQRGGLIFRTVEGLHMQIPDDLIMEVAREFLGSSKTLGHSGEQQIVIQNGFS